jgi:prefoldin subunit 5
MFNKKPEVKADITYENVYSVLNKEIERLYKFISTTKNEVNVQEAWRRITAIQNALIEALKDQPAHDKSIKDLQETVTELLLLTGTESR